MTHVARLTLLCCLLPVTECRARKQQKDVAKKRAQMQRNLGRGEVTSLPYLVLHDAHVTN